MGEKMIMNLFQISEKDEKKYVKVCHKWKKYAKCFTFMVLFGKMFMLNG
jgi:hypothetical protein